MPRALLGGLACALVGACSPYNSNGAFACSQDSQCDPGGSCKAGFCAFPDTSCASMLRYGDQSGAMSNQCVGGGTTDAGTDAKIFLDGPGDSPPGQFCYGGGTGSLVTACFATAPATPIKLTADIDTDTSPLCMQTLNSVAACVVAGSDVGIDAGVTVHAQGTKPLVIVASQSITIAGTLDLSSPRGGTPGAAANGSACHAGTAPGTGAGGAGGSLGGLGGNGGGTSAGASGGTAGAIVTLTSLQGGCKGQNGNGGMPGPGSNGGGAVHLIGHTSIVVSGTINASGGGGNGATSGSAGGGGGGSGGYIGLESALVQVSGNIFANGGGGGQGSGNTTFGNDGGDPQSPATAAPGGQPATGGSSSVGGGGGAGNAGGVAASAGSPGLVAGTSVGGGGAGGGGAGIVKLISTNPQLSGAISPPPS